MRKSRRYSGLISYTLLVLFLSPVTLCLGSDANRKTDSKQQKQRGYARISSEDKTIGVDEMIAEFKIELLDDYMMRALAHRHTPGNME